MHRSSPMQLLKFFIKILAPSGKLKAGNLRVMVAGTSFKNFVCYGTIQQSPYFCSNTDWENQWQIQLNSKSLVVWLTNYFISFL